MIESLLLTGIKLYQNRITEFGAIPTTSELVKQALIKGGIGQGLQSYYRVCLRRGVIQEGQIEGKWGKFSKEKHNLLVKIFTNLFAVVGPIEAVITLAGGGEQLKSLYVNTPVVDWTGDKGSVTHHLHTDSGLYSQGDLPEEIGGRPVEWDTVETNDSGGTDATFNGHYKD